MDKSVVVTYGFIIVTTMVMVVLIALATPFGMYIGDAMVAYAKSSEQNMDHQLNDGFQSNLEEFENMLNGDSYIGYIESGIYKTHESYNTIDGYKPTYEKLLYNWKTLSSFSVVWTDSGILKGSHTYKNVNGEQIKDKSHMSEQLQGDLVLTSSALYIDNECFMNCEFITSVYMKETSSIGDRSFKGCTKLKSILLDSTNMETIGAEAFKDSGLKHIFYSGTKAEFQKILWASQDAHGNNLKSGITVTVHCTDQVFQANI